MNIENKEVQVLISKEEIQKRVKQLGEQITRDYDNEEVLLICILKGAMVFYSDLLRSIDLTVETECMIVSSYGNDTSSSGTVTIKHDVEKDICGKNVIIVEDIIDTGFTLDAVYKELQKRGPKTLEVCVMFDKKERRNPNINIEPRYIGIQVPDKFILGYGLDYKEKYRNLENLCVLI